MDNPSPHNAATPDRQNHIAALYDLTIVTLCFLGVRAAASAIGISFAGPIAIVATLGVATYLLWRSSGSWAGLGLRSPLGLRQWLLLTPLTAIAMGLTFFVAVILVPNIFGLSPDYGAAAGRFDFLRGDLIAFLAFLLLVAWGTAAFGEEMLFRGFLVNRFELLFGEGRWAIGAALISQAILFGLGHAYQGWYGIVTTGLIGLVMGLVYLTGRRWLAPVIIAHGLIDTLSLSQIYSSG